jgi:hypothetical protein
MQAVDPPRPVRPSGDQADGLRRLFVPGRLRTLPVFVPSLHCASRSAWLAKLAQGFARHGNRTLLVDAVRAQVAAVLGLRARFDWLHVLRGECTAHEAVLDAAPGLTVVPAARAFAYALDARIGLDALLAPLLAQRDPGFDLAVVLLSAGHARVLPPGDVLVPVSARPRDLALALADVCTAVERADISVFRLLFLGMDSEAAGTLAQRMAARARQWSAAELASAGCVRVARDLWRVVVATAGWRLAALAPPELESLS